jgi:hypothetical protein
MSDWNTVDGAEALAIGKRAEREVVASLRERGFRIDHLAEDPLHYNIGYDVIVNNKRTEIKSNSGVDAWGAPYGTCCVEKITKIGRPIGWSQGKSDRVLFFNRSNRLLYVYEARHLQEWSVGRWTFKKHGADCLLMPWECNEAGFLCKVQL